MKTRIVKIGNSQGVRIPKPLIEETGLKGEVEINAHNGALIIRAAKKPREGWDAAFKMMAEQANDAPPGPDATFPTQWDVDEWEWR